MHKLTGFNLKQLKASIFDGVRIEQLINEGHVIPSMNEIFIMVISLFYKQLLWYIMVYYKAYGIFIKNYYGNNTLFYKKFSFQQERRQLIEEPSFILTILLSITVRYLHGHLDSFPKERWAIDRNGQRFH